MLYLNDLKISNKSQEYLTSIVLYDDIIYYTFNGTKYEKLSLKGAFAFAYNMRLSLWITRLFRIVFHQDGSDGTLSSELSFLAHHILS